MVLVILFLCSLHEPFVYECVATPDWLYLFVEGQFCFYTIKLHLIISEQYTEPSDHKSCLQLCILNIVYYLPRFLLQIQIKQACMF